MLHPVRSKGIAYNLEFVLLVRFLNSSKFDALPVSWSRLVYQAVEQCFVGTSLQFGFRVYSLGRTNSQIAHNCPFHLKNIVKKQPTSEKTHCWPEGLPNLLACQIFPCCLPDQQSPTVMHILNEYLDDLQRNTPQSFSARSSQYSLLTDYSLTEGSCKTQYGTRCASLQGQRASPMYCTPQEFCCVISPLVLTGSSQPSSGIIQEQEKSLGSNKTKLADGYLGLKGWSLVTFCNHILWIETLALCSF